MLHHMICDDRVYLSIFIEQYGRFSPVNGSSSHAINGL